MKRFSEKPREVRDEDGRYSHAMDRVCRCGHAKWQHAALGDRYCMYEDGGGDCSCPGFRPAPRALKGSSRPSRLLTARALAALRRAADLQLVAPDAGHMVELEKARATLDAPRGSVAVVLTRAEARALNLALTAALADAEVDVPAAVERYGTRGVERLRRVARALWRMA